MKDNDPMRFFREVQIFSFCMFFVLGGCTGTQRYNLKENCYTPFKSCNSYDAGDLPEDITRVAVLPIFSDKLEGELLENIDETFKGELLKQNRFEVITISRQQLYSDFQKMQFSSAEVLPSDFLGKLETISDSNAILFIDLTHYKPYKPVALGVRCKLVDVRSGEVLWAFDTLFDSGNPPVAVAARRFQLGHQKTQYPLDLSTSILKSPNRFAQYVAHDVFDTLPYR